MGRRRERTVAHQVAAAVAAVALVVAAPACTSGGSSGSAAAVGKEAPAFVTDDVNGNRVHLADYAGHPVLVNFWASWCGPCRQEFPVLRQLMDARPDVRVLGVVFDDSAAAARRFAEEQHATWPALVDPKHQIADAYGVAAKPGIPVTVVVDRDGVVRARHLGPITSLAEAEKLLATPSGT
jgi:cytochrome c biogenesis protein CcmG/thiol:disulfide interchange protein DsbE